jgi:MFS family permease
MGVRAHAREPLPRVRSRGPALAATLVVVLAVFLLLAANGRALSAPTTSWGAGLVLSAALAFAGLVLEIDATGASLLGKALAALFAALAAGALFAAVARRHGPSEGRWAGFVLALGTTLASAAQAWSGEAAATFAVAFAVLLLVRAEQDDRALPAAQAGLPLGLAVALQPTTAPLALVMALAVVARWRGPGLMVLAWSLPGVLAGLGSLVAPPSVAAPAAVSAGALALLASPAKGLLLFVPVAIVALVGLVRSLRAPKHRMWDQAPPSRLLPLACLAAAMAHVVWVAAVGGWNEGPFWGPRLLAPAWPLLLLYLPEGFAALRTVASILVLASIGVQALGLVSYDGRWDKVEAARASKRPDSAWDFGNGPIAFHARERVARVAVPALEGRRLTSHERTFAPSGNAGSFVSFARIPAAPTGADQTFDGLRFDGGARFEAGQLVLAAEGDGVGLRVRDGARPRRLELRIVGRGSGRLGLAESGTGTTRWRDSAVSGSFRLRLPYFYADSGGPDLRIALRSGGPIAIDSIALVPPSEPDNVLRLP